MNRTGFYACFGVESAEGKGHGNSHGASERQHTERQPRHDNRHNDTGHNDAHHERHGHGHGAGHYHEGDQQHTDGNAWSGGAHRSPYRHWDALVQQLREKNPDWQLISIKKESAEVVPAGRRSMRAADQYTYSRRNGEITDVQTYDAQPRETKVKSAVYMVHTGSWGGLPTRILTFLAALLGSTLPLTGYWLWLRRKFAKSKHKATKAPERSERSH